MFILPEKRRPHHNPQKKTKLGWQSLHSMRSIWSFCLKPGSDADDAYEWRLEPRESRLALGGSFLLAFLAFLGGFNVTTIIFKTTRYGWSDADIGIYNAVYVGMKYSTCNVNAASVWGPTARAMSPMPSTPPPPPPPPWLG